MKLKFSQLFFFTLIIHLLFISLEYHVGRICTKPLLLIILIVWYINSCVTKNLPVVSALSFSLLGDILLMGNGQLFFITGLIAFLMAHVFYCIFFWNALKRKSSGIRWQPLFFIVPYVMLLLWILMPHLGGLQIPVSVYAVVIGAMFFLAINVGIRVGGFSKQTILGAGLFVVSDTLLALNLFRCPFFGASFFIMLTYGLAQFLIVNSIILAQHPNLLQAKAID